MRAFALALLGLGACADGETIANDAGSESGEGEDDGGGGGDDLGVGEGEDGGEGVGVSGPPPAKNLQLSGSPIRQLDFTWSPAYAAKTYQLLEALDPTMPNDFVPVGPLLSGTAVSLYDVPLIRRLGVRYAVEACNKIDCTTSAPLLVESIVGAAGYIKASNTGVGDWFGYCVALSADGQTFVVGAPQEDSAAAGVGGDESDDSAVDAGAVYVYTRDPMTLQWSQNPTYIKASNTDAGDGFGRVVALSADGLTLAVGARDEDSVATGVGGDESDNSALNAGAVYVYTRDPMTLQWSQSPAYIKASNTNEIDNFGYEVALSADGHTLAVGAPGEDSGGIGVNAYQLDNMEDEAGAVYVYTRDPMTLQWSPDITYIKASNTRWADFFGSAVALSADGHTLAVGAIYEDSAATGVGGDELDDSAHNAGAAYVYTRDPMTLQWFPDITYIKASNTDVEDEFGGDLALSADGHTLAVGAIGEDSAVTGLDADMGGDSGDESAAHAGAVYVYTRDPMTLQWLSDPTYVKASNSGFHDAFGGVVRLSGDGHTLAVSATGEDSAAAGLGGDASDDSTQNAGAVYVYTRDPMTLQWSPDIAYVKASNTEPNDFFGRSSALSADGQTLVVGAHREDSGATGVGGDASDNSVESAGAVYVY